jgi:hypothetical protein
MFRTFQEKIVVKIELSARWDLMSGYPETLSVEEEYLDYSKYFEVEVWWRFDY